MKKFLKIFLICFSSLMGVFAASYGVALLFGAFNTPVIQPEDLTIEVLEDQTGCYLEEQKIFASNEFKIVIKTSNEEVTQLNLELSLESASATVFENKVSDGIIRIPTTAKIGEPFKVEFIKVPTVFNVPGYPQEELDWVKGGISKIIAKSATNILLQPVSVDVYVDVPVYKMTLSAYSNVENATPATELVVGSIFNVQANFYPEDSRYKFSQKDILTTSENEAVYKTLYLSQHINEIPYYERYNNLPLVQNIFKSNKVGDVEIVGYVFNYAIDEYMAEKVYIDANNITQTYDDDDIYTNIRDLMNLNSFASLYKNTLDLSFVEVTEYNFIVSAEKKSFGENTTFQYFANYTSQLNSGNFGMVFSSNNQSLSIQHEILNTGVSVVRKIDDNYIPYNANFSQNSNVFYLAYENISSNTLINPIQYRELAENDKESYIPSVLDTLDGLSADKASKYMTFYLPKNSVYDVNKSFWELSVLDAGEYEFIVFYKNPNNKSELQIGLKTVEFEVLGAQSDPIHWNDISDKNLIIRYDENGDNARINSYNLKTVNGFSNINIPVTNKYTTERYFIYSTKLDEFDSLSNYINCTEVHIKDYTEYKLYEVDNGIIEFIEDSISDCKNLEFYALFATLKTNGDGSIRIENGEYIVDRIVTNDTNEFNQPIKFKVLDSLYNIEGMLTAVKEDSVLVYTQDIDGQEGGTQEEVNTLILKQNVADILKLELSSNQEELLLSEYNAGMIQLIAKSSGSNQDIISDIMLISKGDNEVKYLLSTKALQNNANINFKIYVKYLRTGEEFLINDCTGVIEEEVTEFEFNHIQIYSAQAKYGFFGDDSIPTGQEGEPEEHKNLAQILGEKSDEPSTVVVSVELSKDEGNNTKLETTYIVDGLAVQLFDEEGNLIVHFLDEYGVLVEDVNYTLESSDKTVLIIQDRKLSFVGVGNATVTLKLGDTVVDKLNFEYKYGSAFLNKITALEELDTPTIDDFAQKVIYSSANGDYTFDEISVEIIGAKNRKINFADEEKGLIEVEYASENPNKNEPDAEEYVFYNLKNHIKYKLMNADISDDLKAMVEFTEDENGYLTGVNFKQHFVKDVRIRIQASIEEIRFNQIISLIIKPNLSISVVDSIETAEVSPENYSDASTSKSYTGVFGNTKVKLDGTISYVIPTNDFATVTILSPDGKPIESYIENFDDGEMHIDDSLEFRAVSYSVVVLIDGKNNEYSYNRDLNYYINPNYKVTLNNELNKVGVNGNNYYVDLDKAITIERIVGTTELVNEDIIIENEIINSMLYEIGSENSNIIKLENKQLYLKKNVTTSKTLNLILNYGEFNVREGANSIEINTPVKTTYYYITLEVVPVITPVFDEDFITYNGKKYLALIENEEYNLNDLAEKFEIANVDTILTCNGLFTRGDVLKYWSGVDSDKIIIQSNINKIVGINNEYYIEIVDANGNTLHYPVIILPFEIPLLANGVEYLKNDQSVEVDDLKNRINSEYLSANQLYLSGNIICGKRIKLSTILSESLVEKYTFSVVNEDVFDSKTYATIAVDGNEKYLVTQLIGEDKYIILNARKGDSGTSVITLSFRIKITSNLEIKTYYPYTDGNEGEFVYFDGKQSLQIDFDEIQNNVIPNKSSVGKRYEVVVGNEKIDEGIQNNKVTFVIESVNLGTSYASASDISKYATFNGSVLTLNNYNDINAFIVNVKIIVGDNIKVANYKVVVSDGLEIYNILEAGVRITGPNAEFNKDTNTFVVDYTPEVTIEGFKLDKQIGDVHTVVNNELRFYLYGSNKCQIASFAQENGKVVISNFKSLIDEKAYLVIYNYAGKYWIYTYEVKSTSDVKLEVNEITAGKRLTIGVLADGIASNVSKVTLEQIVVNGNAIHAVDNVISYLNSNGTTSKVSVDTDEKTIIVTPFDINAELLLNVKFEYNEEEYTKQFTVTINSDLTSKYADRGLPFETDDVDAGKPNESVNISDLFDGSCNNYDLEFETLSDSNLVKDFVVVDDKLKATFANSATGGEVLVKITAIYKWDKTYYLESYVKYIVKANLKLTINYPSVNGETQNSEVVASGYTLNLSGIGIFGDKQRVVLTDMLGASKSIDPINDKMVDTSGVIVDYNSFVLTLEPGKAYGNIVFKIKYFGDLIGEYNVVVRKTWADVIVPALKNEDGTFNGVDNPEKYMDSAKLDIADFVDDEAFFKKLVFGGVYDKENDKYIYSSKSELRYNVSLINNQIVSNELFECVVEDKNKTTNEESNTVIIIDIKIAGILIAQYHVEFAFQVKFNKTIVELQPGENGKIKDLYEITYKDTYIQTIKKREGGVNDLKVYTKDENQAWVLNKPYTDNFKGFITFEQNGTNIEVHGAPNNGVRIEFTVVISCRNNNLEQLLTCIVMPNYNFEIISDEPYVVDSSMFNGADEKILTLATSDPVTSTIVVRRENDSQDTNLIINSTLWTFKSSDENCAKLYIDNLALMLKAHQSTFAISDAVITIKDKFDYTFTFAVRTLPNESNLVKFNSSNFSIDELENFDIKENINKFSGMTIESVKMQEIVAGVEPGLPSDFGKAEIIQMPAVNETRVFTLYVTIKKGEESTTISTNINVKKRYELVTDESYYLDGVLYLRDGESLNLYDYYNVKDLKLGLEYGKRSLVHGESFNITMDENDFKLDDFESKGFATKLEYFESLISEGIFIYQIPVGTEQIFKASEWVNKDTNMTADATDPSKYYVNFDWKKESDYSGYKYMLEVTYVDDAEIYLDRVWQYTNIINENGNKLEFTAEKNADGTYKTPAKARFIKVNEEFVVSQLDIYEGYRVGSDHHYYLPVVNSQFENIDTEKYTYMWTYDLFTEPVSFNGNDKSGYDIVVTDSVFSIDSCKEETIEVKFVGDEKQKLIVELNEGKNKFSLRAKMSDYQDGLILLTDTKNSIYKGIWADSLKKIKGLNVTSESILTVDIKNDNISVWDYPDSTPLYQTSKFVIPAETIVYGKKLFDERTITYRAIPSIVNLSDSTGKITYENGYSRVTTYVDVTERTTSIERSLWSDAVYVASTNSIIEVAGQPQKLKDYKLSSGFSFVYELADAESAETAEISADGNVTLKEEFDIHSGHVSIDVYILKKSGETEIYKVKVGKVVIIPDVK